MENDTRSVYYNAFPLTLYFQVQFIKVHCTANVKNTIKCAIKKERLSARQEKDLLVTKRKYHDDPGKKRRYYDKDESKKRYYDKDESIRLYSKEKFLNNQASKITDQKAKYQEHPEVQLPYKKCKYLETAES